MENETQKKDHFLEFIGFGIGTILMLIIYRFFGVSENTTTTFLTIMISIMLLILFYDDVFIYSKNIEKTEMLNSMEESFKWALN